MRKIALILLALMAGVARADAPIFLPGDEATLQLTFACKTAKEVVDLNTSPNWTYRKHLLDSGECWGPPTNQIFVVKDLKAYKGTEFARIKTKRGDRLWWVLYGALVKP